MENYSEQKPPPKHSEEEQKILDQYGQEGLDWYGVPGKFSDSKKETDTIDKGEEEQLSLKETVLSPEVLEMVMAKVQDIDQDGTAYHISAYGTRESFSSTLSLGILGNYMDTNDLGKVFDKQEWIQAVRGKETKRWSTLMPSRPSICFHIIGRSTPNTNKRGLSQIAQLYPMTQDKYAIPIMFDMSKLKEVKKHWYTKLKIGEYMNDLEERHNSKGESRAESSHGFVLSARVAPRLFKGLVMDKDFENIETITSIMGEAYKDKKELYLPIYNVNGDLLWPKQMSYEEVKKFVAEREKKSPDKENLE
ncbi:MAG: hypothetical protein PHS53_05035 [Candidatus Pacebacteria bacterium]|nr:hypothetical protein [Candidatus Paceibacterota bacterium]